MSEERESQALVTGDILALSPKHDVESKEEGPSIVPGD